MIGLGGACQHRCSSGQQGNNAEPLLRATATLAPRCSQQQAPETPYVSRACSDFPRGSDCALRHFATDPPEQKKLNAPGKIEQGPGLIRASLWQFATDSGGG